MAQSMDRTMCAAQYLPHDLVRVILPSPPDSHLFSLHPTTLPLASVALTIEYYRNLLSIASVCRQWHHAAIEGLFQTVVIWRPGQLSTILLAANRDRLCLTKYIRIIWNRQPAIPNDPELSFIPPLLECVTPSRHLWDEDLDEASRNDGLRWLTIAGDNVDLSPGSFLVNAIEPLANSLEGLSICAVEDPEAGLFEVIRFGPQGKKTPASMGACLKSLRHVKAVRFDEFRSAHATCLPYFSARPTQLTLIRCALEPDNMIRLFNPLAGYLKELRIERTSLGPFEIWFQILTKLGEGGLKVLSMTECDVWATWSTARPASLADTAFTSCPFLESLTLSGLLDAILPTMDYAPHTSLQKLYLSSPHIPWRLVVQAMNAGKWPALQDLIVGKGARWDQEGENQVKLVAGVMDITLRTE